MKKKAINKAASVRALLLNVAKQTAQDNNAVVSRYAQERFIYRLSVSPYRNNFVLKGALLLLPYKLPITRPTKDIDFLGKGISNDLRTIQNIMHQIIQIQSDDGIKFYSDEIYTETIAEQDEYHGTRCKVRGDVGGVAFTLQIDIGFGDEIVPSPIEIDFPVILDNPVPRVQAYSLESAAAEKLEAIVNLNYQTSRMKDFFDLAFLLNSQPFDPVTLGQAIRTTFTNRQTRIDDIRQIFSEEFISDARLQKQWNAFLRRQKIETGQSFRSVIEDIQHGIEPLFTERGKQRQSKIPG